MSRPRTPNDVVYPNQDCKYYLKAEGKDIRKQGKNSAGHQRYQCMHCKTYFVETSNTHMYRRHISEEELILIGKLLTEKIGNRAISRVTGLTLVTVSRVIDDIILHAAEFNALMTGKAKVGPVELDERWTFVKNKKVDEGTANTNFKGDAWIYAGVKRDAKFIVGFAVGKRTQDTCDRFLMRVMNGMELPTPSTSIEFYSDGNDQYDKGLEKIYGPTCYRYGQLSKTKSGGKLIKINRHWIVGEGNLEDIQTSQIENLNGIERGC